jgi:hypothetical protein
VADELNGKERVARRAGPHNQHHDNGLPHLFHSDHLVYLAHFNAGLRLYDTSDPEHVREIGYFLPPDPETRFGVFPSRLVAQTEDVIVDARGYAYISDKNQGVYVVRRGPHEQTARPLRFSSGPFACPAAARRSGDRGSLPLAIIRR